MARTNRFSSRLSIVFSILSVIGFVGWSHAAKAQTIGVPPNTFYVSTVGNDAWSGRLSDPNSAKTDGPFATLAKARDAIRALHPLGPLLSPVTVYVRGGVYQLADTLTFSPQDSGTSSAPITYAAYGSEQPVLSGGRPITGWTRYNGTAAPQATAGKLWVAQVPGVTSGWHFNQLFVNGKRAIRARTPNVGSYFNVNGMAQTWPAPAQFQYNGNDMQPQWATGGVEVVLLEYWTDTRAVINGVNTSAKTVSLQTAINPFATENNPRYWVENTLDALDTPGEWYLDQKTGNLYYYPRPGDDMTTASAVAPYLVKLVQLAGDAASGKLVSDIKLRGLTFSHTDWVLPAQGHVNQASYDIPAAVTGFGTRSCAIEKNLFSHLGGYALELSQGSQNDTIVGNDIMDIGTGGIKIGDPNVPAAANLNSGSNQVTDNTIFDIGLALPSGAGIWVGQSADNIVAHNEIYNTYYAAISLGWTWGSGASGALRNTVQYNDLHDIGLGMLSDFACIYTLGIETGTVISYNLCHDVSRYPNGYGGVGIGHDSGSANMVVENNLVYGTQDVAWGVNSVAGIIVRNNIFAMGQTGQLSRPGANAFGQNFDFERNIVYWTKGEFFGGFWQDTINFKLDNNLYYCPGDCPTNSFPSFSSFLTVWKSLGEDVNSLVSNPLFMNPLLGDFRLASGSPASKVGFRPFDLSTVGPRAAQQR